MLNYNIYSHLSNEEYTNLEKRLIVIEAKMMERLFPLGWELTTPILKNDGLIVDFIVDEKMIMGNLGINYEDKPGIAVFSFYVTKGYDEGEKRYFIKKILYENKNLAFYEKSLELIIEKALLLYNSWSEQYLIKNGS